MAGASLLWPANPNLVGVHAQGDAFGGAWVNTSAWVCSRTLAEMSQPRRASSGRIWVTVRRRPWRG
ncbi:hypothetical protein DMB66_25640 [Actinoplanes sp. ATCC 53533]|nr:hypothetical protein DMB66_25640 [Actinoplanes sp. ATCC 53533]